MKNKDKYKLNELDWQISKKPKDQFLMIYETKIYLCKDGKRNHIVTLKGGAHSDLLTWLESEAIDEEK